MCSVVFVVACYFEVLDPKNSNVCINYINFLDHGWLHVLIFRSQILDYYSTRLVYSAIDIYPCGPLT